MRQLPVQWAQKPERKVMSLQAFLLLASIIVIGAFVLTNWLAA
ncbi:MAG TPA: hypothetical protein VG939_00365 [Caulobacteraceae bacterium]|nr:hypothetical protein [Caulobacteraceae bacterium]